jgi:hypothetical protein
MPLPNSLFLSSASFEVCDSSSEEAACGEAAACLAALGSAAALSDSAQQRRWAATVDVLDALLLKASGGPVLTIMLLAVRRQGLSMRPLRLVLARLATASCTGPCARSPAPRPVARSLWLSAAHPRRRGASAIAQQHRQPPPPPQVSAPPHRWFLVCRFQRTRKTPRRCKIIMQSRIRAMVNIKTYKLRICNGFPASIKYIKEDSENSCVKFVSLPYKTLFK